MQRRARKQKFNSEIKNKNSKTTQDDYPKGLTSRQKKAYIRKKNAGQPWLTTEESKNNTLVKHKQVGRGKPIRKNRKQRRIVDKNVSIRSQYSKGPFDTRIVASAAQIPDFLENQSPSIVIEANLALSAIQTVCLPFIGKCYEKGFISRVLNKTAGSQGEKPPVDEMPEWLLSLFRALRPKTVTHLTGKVDYRWRVPTWTNIPSTVVFPNTITPTLARYNIGFPSGTVEPVTGYIEWTPSTATYTDDLGAEVYSQIIDALSDLFEFKMVPSESTKTVHDYEGSAFASNIVTLGSTIGVGSYQKYLELESKIRYPYYSVFCNDPDDGSSVRPNRAAFDMKVFSGDTTSLGMKVIDGTEGRKNALSKIPHTYKYIDFIEIWDVFTTWLVKCFQQKKAQNVYNDPYYETLPFNAFDALLLLRQALMSNFAESQYYAMGMSYDFDSDFIPFLPSTNCRPEATFATMRLPCILVENLKALRMRTTSVLEGNVYSVIPVLGMYSGDSYVTNPSWEEDKNIFVDSSIVPNLWECSTGSPAVFIEANGRKLKGVLDQYNEFVSKNFSNVSVPMEAIVHDSAISFFECISLTRIHRTEEAARDPKEKKPKKPLVVNKFEQAVTSQQPFSTAAWEECQRYFILPTWRLRNSDTYPLYDAVLQVTAKEPYMVSYDMSDNNTSNGSTIVDHSQTLGSLCVLGQGGRPSGLEQIIELALKRAEGGDIGDLIEAFARWLGGPTAGMITKRVVKFVKTNL